MRLKLAKSIGIVLGITAILLASPTICAASMEAVAGGEETSGACRQADVSQPCFATSSGSLSHCVLIKALGEQVKPPRLVSYDNVCLSGCQVSDGANGHSQVLASPYQKDILKIPISNPIVHHCRNLLSSEEPPL